MKMVRIDASFQLTNFHHDGLSLLAAISFEISDYTIREDESPLSVQITASGHSDSPYNVTITPRSGTASGELEVDHVNTYVS